MTERLFEEPIESSNKSFLDILSPRSLARKIRALKRGMPPDWPAFSPPLEHGSARLSSYEGADGPVATLAQISRNIGQGKEPGEGLPPDPLNDSNAP